MYQRKMELKKMSKEILHQKLTQISSELNIKFTETNFENIQSLKKTFPDNILIEVLAKSWLNKPTLLDYNGNYLFKLEEFDEDGFPTTDSINYILGFVDLETILIDKDFQHLSQEGFLQLAYTVCGDYLVIDMTSKDFYLGIISHEYIWGEKFSLRKLFSKLLTFNEFLDYLLENRYIDFSPPQLKD